MGMVVMLAMATILNSTKYVFPQRPMSPMAVIKREGLVFSYRGPGGDSRIWIRPITSMPGLKVVQIKGEEPAKGEVLTCRSSVHVIGRLRADNTEVNETWLSCTGDAGQKVEFRVIGITL
jgi:hypothetical protein